MPTICNYEGSRYSTEFWTPERAFEDLADRAAVQALLPEKGATLVEIGAGFGRLASLYTGYRRVVLFDYALSMLEEARQRLDRDPRFLFVAGDLYRLPLASHCFQAVVMVRVMHHLEDVPAALVQLARIVHPHGSLILEYANKRNLKAILRYLLRRQDWSPFDPHPYPFVPLHYNFHPAWVTRHLARAGLQVDQARAVSHFRVPWLKRHIPPRWLARADALLQRPGALFKLSPSIFLRARPHGNTPVPTCDAVFFRCPHCEHEPLPVPDGPITCPHCGTRWDYENGIYNFKVPVAHAPAVPEAS